MNGCAKSPIYRENAHNEWRFVSRFDWGRIDSVICIFAVWEIQERIKSKQNNKNKKNESFYNLWWSLWFRHIWVPFGAQVIAGRIAVVSRQWHLEKWHLILSVAGAEHWHTVGRWTAITVDERWRWRTTNEQLLAQSRAGRCQCIHSTSTCTWCHRWRRRRRRRRCWVGRGASANTVRLIERFARLVRWIRRWSLPRCCIAQFSQPIWSPTFHIIIIIAGCATVFIVDIGLCEFYRDFIIVHFHIVGANTIDRRILLLFRRHFIKIFEYAYNRQFDGAYTHYTLIGREPCRNDLGACCWCYCCCGLSRCCSHRRFAVVCRWNDDGFGYCSIPLEQTLNVLDFYWNEIKVENVFGFFLFLCRMVVIIFELLHCWLLAKNVNWRQIHNCAPLVDNIGLTFGERERNYIWWWHTRPTLTWHNQL